MLRAFPVTLLILAGQCMTGAETNSSWDQLMQRIKVGRKVVVTRTDKTKVEGQLLSIGPDSIKVRRGLINKEEMEVRREDVTRVRYADIRKRNTLIGLAAGAGLGAGIGAGSDSSYEGAIAAILGGALGGIGAAVGGVLPIGKPLYEVPKQLRRAAVSNAAPPRR